MTLDNVSQTLGSAFPALYNGYSSAFLTYPCGSAQRDGQRAQVTLAATFPFLSLRARERKGERVTGLRPHHCQVAAVPLAPGLAPLARGGTTEPGQRLKAGHQETSPAESIHV